MVFHNQNLCNLKSHRKCKMLTTNYLNDNDLHLFTGAEEGSNPGSLPHCDCLCLRRVSIGGEHPWLELGIHLLLRRRHGVLLLLSVDQGKHLLLRGGHRVLLLHRFVSQPLSFWVPIWGRCSSVWCSFLHSDQSSRPPLGPLKARAGSEKANSRRNILYVAKKYHLWFWRECPMNFVLLIHYIICLKHHVLSFESRTADFFWKILQTPGNYLICCKFGHQVAPLASDSNFPPWWRYSNCHVA